MHIHEDIGLSRTKAPRLEALYIGYCSPQAVISFITRSACLPQSLHVTLVGGPPFLYEVLEHLTSLVLLSISAGGAMPSIQILRSLSGIDVDDAQTSLTHRER